MGMDVHMPLLGTGKAGPLGWHKGCQGISRQQEAESTRLCTRESQRSAELCVYAHRYFKVPVSYGHRCMYPEITRATFI